MTRRFNLKQIRSWFLILGALSGLGFFLGYTSPNGSLLHFHVAPQEVLLYTESVDLAKTFQDLEFSDWKLEIKVIEEAEEWEIKTVTGGGAHLILVEHELMERLDRMSLLERARIRVPLFSFLNADFRKSNWEKIYLPLFWQNKGPDLNGLKIWGLSVPQNTTDRRLSWKAFYEIVGHPFFKARLAGSGLGLTLEEFEESPIPAEHKPSFVRQKSTLKGEKSGPPERF